VDLGEDFDVAAIAESVDARRLGLLFADADLEGEYRVRHLDQSLPFIRLGLLAAGLAWLGNWLPHIFWARPRPSAPWMLGLGWCGMWALAGSTALRVGRRYAEAIAGVGVAVSGLISIVVSFSILHDWPTAAAGIIIIMYFALTVFHLRPLVAAMSSGAVAIGFQVVVLAEAVELQLSSLQVVSAVTTTTTALATGVLLSIFVDRSSRRAFAQERIIAAQAKALEVERARTDALLLNVLPASIVERLKSSSGSVAESFDEVTVLFADVVGFTPLAAKIPAAEVVDILDRVFTRFDELAEELEVEKIKTIGDAYMAVAGAPTPRDDHIEAIAELALRMQAAVPTLHREGMPPLSFRIGVATGPAVGGVIGRRKFSYDLWGATVNLAARLESYGTPGYIQVSEATSIALRRTHHLESRGELELKGIGRVPAWYLLDRRTTPAHEQWDVPTSR
jgi:class 3 adenylate cyclase